MYNWWFYLYYRLEMKVHVLIICTQETFLESRLSIENHNGSQKSLLGMNMPGLSVSKLSQVQPLENIENHHNIINLYNIQVLLWSKHLLLVFNLIKCTLLNFFSWEHH